MKNTILLLPEWLLQCHGAPAVHGGTGYPCKNEGHYFSLPVQNERAEATELISFTGHIQLALYQNFFLQITIISLSLSPRTGERDRIDPYHRNGRVTWVYDTNLGSIPFSLQDH